MRFRYIVLIAVWLGSVMLQVASGESASSTPTKDTTSISVWMVGTAALRPDAPHVVSSIRSIELRKWPTGSPAGSDVVSIAHWQLLLKATKPAVVGNLISQRVSGFIETRRQLPRAPPRSLHS